MTEPATIAYAFVPRPELDTPEVRGSLAAAFNAGLAQGRASERQRIREAVFANPDHLVGNRRHGESAMSWRQRALHAALEDPDVV